MEGKTMPTLLRLKRRRIGKCRAYSAVAHEGFVEPSRAIGQACKRLSVRRRR